ncbi:MAG TPA: transcription activator effector-binding protein [Flavobacteriia bacterium]|nr:transcription activator effector-binding protein [Flavobacteriia bacterium]
MKALKYIFFLLLLVIIGGAIYIATLENSYKVARTRLIKAPAQVVYNTVNDYKSWPSWSPWLEKDSLAVVTYGDNTVGKGASYAWKSSHKEVGEGSIETIEAKPYETIHQRISFEDWDSESDIYWNFKPIDGGTEVTWSMKGKMNFMFKAYAAFTGGMEKQVGPNYERGLYKLDSVVQATMKKYSISVNGITTHSGGYYLYNTTSCKIDEFDSKMQEMMHRVKQYVQKNNIQMAGKPFTLYHTYDEENNAVIFSSAVPVPERVITEAGSGILTGMLKPFKALKTTLKGDYVNLKEAWETANGYLTENGLEQVLGSPAMEVYSTGPETTPNPAEWLTEIYIPIK